MEIIGDKEERMIRISYAKEQLIEVSVFLFLIVPSMVFSFFAIKQGSVSFVLAAVATITRDLALVGLILFFLWRNREEIRTIGLKLNNLWTEAVLGIVLFFPLFYVAGVLERALINLGLTTPSSTPLPSMLPSSMLTEMTLGTIMVVVVAFAEEAIFRGYLILRFKHILSSVPWAVFLSVFIFTLGHGYEGSAGLMTVAFAGTIFALVYLWRGSLIAPMVMHFLVDFVSIVLVPILGMR